MQAAYPTDCPNRRLLTLGRISHDPALQQWTQMTTWAAYASHPNPPWSQTDVHQVCGQVVEQWTLSRWRKVNGSWSGV